jgi:hypothetical protein
MNTGKIQFSINHLSPERIFFYVMCFLAASPLLFSRYLPMVDMPQHAAEVATLNNLWFSSDYAFRHLFIIDYARPYWGGYAPLLFLNIFFPIDIATKVLVATIIISIPLMAAKLRALFSNNAILDWLTLPIGYGFAFQWGFLSFFVGVPFALYFLYCAFRFVDSPTFKMAVILAILSNILIAIHLMIAGFGCGLAIIYILAQKKSIRQKLILIAPFLASLPYTSWWILTKRIAEENITITFDLWQLSWPRILESLTTSTGEPFVLFSIIPSILIYVLPFLAGYRLIKNRAILMIFISLILWILLGPSHFMGTSLIYNRFTIFMLPLYILFFTSSAPPLQFYQKAARVLIIALPITLIGNHAFRHATFELESKGYQHISQLMQPEKRALSFIFSPISKAYHDTQFLHFPAWYQAEKNGITDLSFASWGLFAQYSHEHASPVEDGFEWNPTSFNGIKHKAWLYDYFVVKSLVSAEKFLLHRSQCPIKLVAYKDDWWLFENNKTQCKRAK